MPLLGSLLKKGIKLSKVIEQETKPSEELQKNELLKLLKKARNTQIGKKYGFKEIIPVFGDKNKAAFYEKYRSLVPVYNYNKIYNEWWQKAKEGEKDVCWPGLVKYFALSSGTSESASKYIPLTDDMNKTIKRTSIRQILSLSNYDLPPELFEKGILMLGGSTHLNKNGHYFEGDLSGIQASKIPFWFQHFYKPGKKISQHREWDKKLDEITVNAKKWDIGFIVGVPAWLQILMEKIIDYYKVDNIHQVWPNLKVFVHGGVSFEPYKKGFEKLLGKPLIYIETYLASEGFIAFQVKPGSKSMKLILNNGIFFEFVPFTSSNFGPDGDLVDNPETLMIDQVEEGKDYAILLNTCAGAWRYLIGDVIRFTNVKEAEIIITGRTKHFLSLCGEHLSVDNMNKAIQLVADELNINIREFTVAGIPYDSLFAHKWYIATDDKIEAARVQELLDNKLKMLNDDYKVERSAALKEIFVDVLPVSAFYNFMKMKGKEGGQNKFPRVMKKGQFEEWEEYLKNNNLK
ncbi:GH3 auxin-responsive promoter family protein [Cytophagaceae bacterium ABcell3]|nr:GH3 auxin-responsive promoter family protein [Cytophagaceae bacterium ABcell3]